MTEQKSNTLASLVVGLIVLCMCVIFWLRHLPYSVPQPGASAIARLVPGFHIVVPGYDWTRSESTLVLGLHVGCVFCEANMPFYRGLINLERTGKTRVHIIAVFPDMRADVEQEIASELPEVSFWPSSHFDALHIRVTPTLFLVDRTGTVHDVWFGELSNVQQGSVLKAIEPGS